LSGKIKCKIVNWDEIHRKCKTVAAKIEKSGYKPDMMIALARSGFVPGRILSDILGVTDLVGLKVEHWLDTTAHHKEKATLPYKIPLKVKGKKVLVVDDIVDTGKSMALSVDYIKSFDPEQLKVAVLQHITASQFIPDYYAVKIKSWTWFIYPWNLTEDLCNLMMKQIEADPNIYKNLGKASQKIKEKYGITVESKLLREIRATLKRRGKIK